MRQKNKPSSLNGNPFEITMQRRKQNCTANCAVAVKTSALPLCLPTKSRPLNRRPKSSDGAPVNGGNRFWLLSKNAVDQNCLQVRALPCLVTVLHCRRLSESGDTKSHFLFVAFDCVFYWLHSSTEKTNCQPKYEFFVNKNKNGTLITAPFWWFLKVLSLLFIHLINNFLKTNA